MFKKMEETGGAHANEKTIREAINRIEKSDAAKSELQKKVLGGMKETARHLKKARISGNVAKVGLGVSGLALGSMAAKGMKKDSKKDTKAVAKK